MSSLRRTCPGLPVHHHTVDVWCLILPAVEEGSVSHPKGPVRVYSEHPRPLKSRIRLKYHVHIYIYLCIDIDIYIYVCIYVHMCIYTHMQRGSDSVSRYVARLLRFGSLGYLLISEVLPKLVSLCCWPLSPTGRMALRTVELRDCSPELIRDKELPGWQGNWGRLGQLNLSSESLRVSENFLELPTAFSQGISLKRGQ